MRIKYEVKTAGALQFNDFGHVWIALIYVNICVPDQWREDLREIAMTSISSPLVFFFMFAVLSLSAVPTSAQNYPAVFYIVLQWPGSYCNAKHGCCYPKTEKPAKDFTIGALQPFHFNGTIPTYCNPRSRLNISKISDLSKSLEKNWPSLGCPRTDSKKVWSKEWKKHGTCSSLTQHHYFEAALSLKKQINLIKILTDAGIQPNGTVYSQGTVFSAIQKAVIYLPGLVCNQDKAGKDQLYQVYLCGDTDSKIVDCPGIPTGKCKPNFKYPSF